MYLNPLHSLASRAFKVFSSVTHASYLLPARALHDINRSRVDAVRIILIEM
jgi:hypothetical protein